MIIELSVKSISILKTQANLMQGFDPYYALCKVLENTKSCREEYLKITYELNSRTAILNRY
jgi:hypothetical protein